MIPIRDTIATRHRPVVNLSLIGINVVVFLVQMTQGPEADRFVYIYGLVPARFSDPRIAAYFSPLQQLFSLLSFMFLHGGFWHILGNMWSLYIFGDNVEDRLGHPRYLAFYLMCGLASGISHLLLNWHSTIPTIGASGAIAGVMGAYFILFPTAKVLTLIPIIFIPWFVEIPAAFFLGLWFLLQFISAAGSHGAVSGIAWWAHIGGFVFGIVFLKLFQLLPSTGIAEKLGPVTEKTTTRHLQVIHPRGSGDTPDLHGFIELSAREALAGTRKLVNIPWGFYTRMLKVTVPAGTAEGSSLRLKGMGRQLTGGARGDLILKVQIR
ncbi:MAG: rhomboid family intramembrane serine protease [Desulfobacterales bacterium]